MKNDWALASTLKMDVLISSLVLVSTVYSNQQPKAVFSPQADYFNWLVEPSLFTLNLLSAIEVQGISHKHLETWLLLRSQKVPTCQTLQS